MASKKHAHKYDYGRVIIANTPVWACAIPMCGHYMPDHMKSAVNGKASVCWKCGGLTSVDFHKMENYDTGNPNYKQVVCDGCISMGKYQPTEQGPIPFSEMQPIVKVKSSDEIRAEQERIRLAQTSANPKCIKCKVNDIMVLDGKLYSKKLCTDCFQLSIMEEI